MPIDSSQLEILRDMFNECHDEWLMLHVNIQQTDRQEIAIKIDNVNEQDILALFGMGTT